MTELTVICARPDGQDEAAGPPISPVLAAVRRYTDRIHFAGRFPSRAIDELLTGRVIVIGEEHQLGAVVLRMLRRGLLGSPESGPPAAPLPVGYIPLQRNEFSTRWELPTGVGAVELACTASPQPVPVVRDDAGGVLIGRGEIDQPVATVYVDERRVLAGRASRIVVRPDPTLGLALTVEQRRPLGLPPSRAVHRGRAVSIGFAAPTIVISDGIAWPRPVKRWTYYAHTEPLFLARPG